MKMTPVGLIPEDWNVIQLADYIVDINDGPFGSNLKSEHYTLDREVRIIQLGNVGDDGWNDENVKYTTFEHASTLKRCIVPYGTVIIAKMMPAGRAIICPSSEPAYIQGSDVIKVVFSDSINKDFFIYLTKSKAYLEQIESGVQGSTRARTNIGKIKSLKLPLPSVEEQKRIAGALLSVDKMIWALDEAIAKKRQIKEGLMQQLLTGRARIPKYSHSNWKKVKLGDIARICTGKRNGDEQNESGLYPFFVRSQTVFRIDTYSFDGEAILVPGEGGIGKIFHYVNGKFDYHQRVYKISDFKYGIDVKFVFYYMKSFFGQYALMNTVKATVDSLRLPTFQDFVMVIPESIEEQKVIASILTDADCELLALESKREKYRLIQQGLMQELLTGKTRLL